MLSNVDNYNDDGYDDDDNDDDDEDEDENRYGHHHHQMFERCINVVFFNLNEMNA